MDFTMIGNVRSYARMKTLKFAANHRLKTGQSLVGSTGTISFKQLDHSSLVNKMLGAQKNSGADAATKKRLATIKKKLLSGKRLSNEEMGFLLKNDSKLYRKAQAAEDARQELKEALSKAKTKQEARKALLNAKMKASAACTAELDAASKAGAGAGGGVSTGGYEASGDMGGAVFSAPASTSNGPIDGGSMAETSSSAEGEPALIAVNNGLVESDAQSSDPTKADPLKVDPLKNNQPKTDPLNGLDETSEDKDTKDDIVEKYLMIIRALDDEWQAYTKSRQYRSLPEDYDDDSKDARAIERDYDRESARQRRAVGQSEYIALEAAAAYRASMVAKN